MMEVTVTYDLRPEMDQNAYEAVVKKFIGVVPQAPGYVELRAQRNILDSPQVRVTHVWRSLADWARFSENAQAQALLAEFYTYTTSMSFQIWGPSPVVPEPLRPSESQ